MGEKTIGSITDEAGGEMKHWQVNSWRALERRNLRNPNCVDGRKFLLA
ncbi:MAG: hypothetical protein ACI9NQ_001419 [Paracoccaceae bacterium]|jgi:hypothetical protein